MLAVALSLCACRRQSVQVTGDVGEIVAELQREKAVIDLKVRDIEQTRMLMKDNLDRDLENLRVSIESIQRALTKIQDQLNAVGSVPPSKTKVQRLPLQVSIGLLVVAVLCVLAVFKLRSLHLRKAEKAAAEGTAHEAIDEPKR
jgi:hypothetical protein